MAKKRIYFTALFIGITFLVGLATFHIRPTSTFCANSISCIHNLNSVVENNAPGYFAGQTIIPPRINLAETTSPTHVLGAQTEPGDKHIYVDLSSQILYAFQGTSLVMQTFISSGKWNPTPPGDYHIWVKLRSTRMSGGEGADAYDLPNVPFVMFFYNSKVSKADGFSLHGAYWHNNFGHPMSHGCVNMRPTDAEALYNWADPPTHTATTYATSDHSGTLVSICSQITTHDGELPQCVE